MNSAQLRSPSTDESSKEMTLPHPQARKDHYGKKDIPGGERVLGNLVKRAVDVANDWNGQNEVNPANDYALDAWLHDPLFPL